jgi:hypothetical protein
MCLFVAFCVCAVHPVWDGVLSFAAILWTLSAHPLRARTCYQSKYVQYILAVSHAPLHAHYSLHSPAAASGASALRARRGFGAGIDAASAGAAPPTPTPALVLSSPSVSAASPLAPLSVTFGAARKSAAFSFASASSTSASASNSSSSGGAAVFAAAAAASAASAAVVNASIEVGGGSSEWVPHPQLLPVFDTPPPAELGVCASGVLHAVVSVKALRELVLRDQPLIHQIYACIQLYLMHPELLSHAPPITAPSAGSSSAAPPSQQTLNVPATPGPAPSSVLDHKHSGVALAITVSPPAAAAAAGSDGSAGLPSSYSYLFHTSH